MTNRERGRVYSEYCKADGVFTSQCVTGFRPADTETHAWRLGRYDHMTQRVDSQSEEVVAYVRPPPDEAPRRRRRALALIAELERKHIRRVLEVLAESDTRIKTAVDEIAQLRADLK